MSPVLSNFLISFGASLAAIVIALLIDRSRLPRIRIKVIEKANDDITYQAGNLKGQRWKFFRVLVINHKMPKVFSWLPRQTAENCRATITITGVDNTANCTYKGRWASTPEIPYYKDAGLIKIIDPDPVTIVAGSSEILDVITKYQYDQEAYGWNNEAYFNDWRTPQYKLNQGKYKIKVTVITQNGTSSIKELIAQIGPTIEETFIQNELSQ
jgi:hypothetical protein